MNAEQKRLIEDSQRVKNWKRWGPYLSERQWGTVREDYSANGDAWDSFTHDHARSRAYRWGEDGLLGITDREGRLCFGLALWNGKDHILKERLYGLTGPEGNHGEDCKELYYYLDSTPTHSYFKGLYKYPQAAFPYDLLRSENQKRSRLDPEFELLDTSIFNENKYFDVFAEYAKADTDDILIKITIHNRSSEYSSLHILPTLWFRNTWIWGCEYEGCTPKPNILKANEYTLEAKHNSLGKFFLEVDKNNQAHLQELIFTDNESNSIKLWNKDTYTPYVKDAFHEYIINKKENVINPKQIGTKTAFYYTANIPGQNSITLNLRLYLAEQKPEESFGTEFEKIFIDRQQETEDFYTTIIPNKISVQENIVQRQAYAGLLWSKQFYHYSVRDWLNGDAAVDQPPVERWQGRNKNWLHLFNRDVISMPDKWEYPWYAAWDLAFHMIPFAKLDPEFAKQQLILMLREWYMHPNGQLPAYEYEFSDVNPPVHAWACWRVYKIATSKKEERDLDFLKRVFNKLLINFTWWVNRKDPEENNIFTGGFLGLDNIGVFDRSKPLPTGGYIKQADGTAWMAFYCLTMLSMSLEIANKDKSYEDIASKFFEHFISIVDAINNFGENGLWDEQDGFYYDELSLNEHSIPLRVRSVVGLVPLFAVEVLSSELLEKLPNFKKRMDWFLKYRADLAKDISYMDCIDEKQVCHERSRKQAFHDASLEKQISDDTNIKKQNLSLLAIPSKEKLTSLLKYLFAEDEFLSDYGIRSVSKFHENKPYEFWVGSENYKVDYVPGESNSGMFGGNSNWRGPIWFPINYLIIESLEKYHYFYGDTFKVEFPTGSKNMITLKEAADEIAKRLTSIFLPTNDENRPCHNNEKLYANDPHFKDLVLFYEYFHGETGRGIGASHQTGWTGLVAKLIEDLNKVGI